jgi:peroxiredoxin
MTIKPYLALIVFFISNGISAQDSYEINLKIEGLEDTVGYLGYHYGNKKYVQDTATIDSFGQIKFKGDKELKKGVYFLYCPKFYMEFIGGESLISIETKKSSIYESMVITGSEENESFRDFQLLMKDYQVKVKYQSDKLAEAKTKSDTTEVYAKLSVLRNLNVKNRDSLEVIYRENYTGALLRLMRSPKELKIETDSITLEMRRKQYKYYKDHYFDGIDFDADGTMRAPVFHNKVKEYLTQVTIQNPDSVIASIDYILEKSKNNDETYRYWLISFLQDYQNAKIMGMDKIFVHISDNYYLNGKAPWADEEMLKKLKDEMIFQRENQIGLKAPEIYLADTLKRAFNLYGLNAKYTILFFYSPTCGHCKKSTPGMLELYHDFKDDGLKVVAVCTDTEMDKWKDFVKDFELDWINVADMDYQSNFRVQYNVRTTPVIYLLDKDKTILAKKLDEEQLRALLNDRIAFEKQYK